MTSFPVSLDGLIGHVRNLSPDGDPLEHLAVAAFLSAELDNQADALLGHFVDRARRSGYSWTQIGEHLGVSKQAARKRFVPTWDGSDPIPEGQLFSRCTLRSRQAMLVAGQIAERRGADRAGVADLVAGLLTEPDGLAARIVHEAGVQDVQVCAALEVPAELVAPRPRGGAPADAAALRALGWTPAGEEALRATLSAAVRLGHNYIGTEHLLLGVLVSDAPTAAALAPLGLTPASVEAGITGLLAAILATPTKDSGFGSAAPGKAEQ